MPTQRARDAENRVGNKLANGPQRVRRNSEPLSISQRRTGVRCRGYYGIPQSVQASLQIKVAPRIIRFVYSSLTECLILSRTFCLLAEHGFGGTHDTFNQTMASLYLNQKT